MDELIMIPRTLTAPMVTVQQTKGCQSELINRSDIANVTRCFLMVEKSPEGREAIIAFVAAFGIEVERY
jgi:hypothetical protein